MEKEDYLNKIREVCKLRGYSAETSKAYCNYARYFLDYIRRNGLNLDYGGLRSIF